MATIQEFKPLRRTHPWKRWTNGKVWRLTAGKDFDGTAEAFRGGLYRYTRTHDKTLAVRSSVKGNVVEFQFFKRKK